MSSIRIHCLAALFLAMPMTGNAVEIYAPRVEFGARLEPGNRIIHGAGQDPKGFDDYADTFDANHQPLIYMTYIGLTNPVNNIVSWGNNLRTELDAHGPAKTIPQIGLSFTGGNDNGTGRDAQVSAGDYDAQIVAFGDALASLNRPVFIRIGYEFEGSWNGYQPATYQQAFRRITQMLSARNLPFATVWCAAGGSSGWPSMSTLMGYYPGDEFVDWWGVDIFSAGEITHSKLGTFLDAARNQRKPVMIGEMTPRYVGVLNGQQSWNQWFGPMIDLLKRRPEIKATAYINWEWAYWSAQLGFNWSNWGDARIERNTVVRDLWVQNLSDPIYLHASRDGSFPVNADVTAVITGSATTGNAPLTVQFSASGSSTKAGTSIANYEWDFDNNGSMDATGVTASHTYTSAGIYTARLVVTNNLGQTSSATLPINTVSQLPFGNNGNRWPIPGRIEAENFDTGGSGIAYQDTDTGNNGTSTYRVGENVDIGPAIDVGDGLTIGWTTAGEWLEYSADVTRSGSYQVRFRVSSGATGGSFRILVDGVNVTGTATIGSTGGWQNWVNVVSPVFGLQAGQRIVRLEFLTSGFNVNWVEFITNSPYDTWAAGFSPADLSNKAGNNDGDALTNFQEYAFGSNPTQATGSIVINETGAVTNAKGSPIAYLAGIIESTVDFRVVFSRRKDYATVGLTYSVEFSTLESGSPWVATLATPTVMDGSDPAIDVVSVPFPAAIQTANGYEKPRFFRVGVSQ